MKNPTISLSVKMYLYHIKVNDDWVPESAHDSSYKRFARWFAHYHLPYLADICRVHTEYDALESAKLFDVIQTFLEKRRADKKRAKQAVTLTQMYDY